MQVLSATTPTADLVFVNGKIITVNSSDEVVEALATAGNRILRVGSRASVQRTISRGTGVVDLRGRALIPGLIEAGMMGIECYYTEHSAAQRAAYLQLCKDRDLVATGGSDFHGPKVRAATLGTPTIPMSAWEALKAKAVEARASRSS